MDNDIIDAFGEIKRGNDVPLRTRGRIVHLVHVDQLLANFLFVCLC